MEILLVVLIGAGVLYYLYRKINQPDSMSDLHAHTVGTPTLPAVTPMPEPQPAPVVEEAKKALDVNKDGRVDLADVKEVAKRTRTRAKKVADLDGDGRVTVKDIKVAASKAKSAATKTMTKAKKPAKK